MRYLNPLRLLIDTDIGTDDAIALVLALQSPRVQVEAITTVAGNTDVAQCVRNARYVLELCGQSLPVYRGADAPIERPRRLRAAAHGDDGLGGLGLRPERAGPDEGDAAHVLIQRIRENPDQLTLVTLGPLTNVAVALREAPDLVSLVPRVVAMAGAAFGPGTVTPRAEFNVWSDPEAARTVLLSGLPLTIVGIELSRGDCALTPSDVLEIERLQTPRSRFVAAMCRASMGRRAANETGPAAGLPDAIAMAVAIDPSLVLKSGRYHVDVETSGELTSGEVVVDALGLLGLAPNSEIIGAVSAPRYKEMLLAACG